jgi:hypothetical protein
VPALPPGQAGGLSTAVFAPEGTFEGIRAALWLGSLWFAGPLLGTRERDAPGRIRDGLILGTAIPFGLACVHLLSGPACALVLAALVALRILRMRRPSAELAGGEVAPSRFALALPTVIVAAYAWPALVRPLLQGDSLGYHLPNAAAWVQSGSLWIATTRAWFYPGGSELFAAGLLATGGPLVLGFAGTGAALLLGFRLAAWGRFAGLPGWVAGALAAFALSAGTLGEQTANLENDLWLGAFFIETLWLVRTVRPGLLPTVAVTGLLKPFGWLYALGAAAGSRTQWRLVLLGLTPFAFWVLRDAILWRGALVPPSSIARGNTFSTTILGHGLEGLTTLTGALARDGIPTATLFALGVGALLFAREKSLRWAAAAALFLFLINPFGFNDANPQLALGWSLRYAAPLLALGAVFGSILLGTRPRVAPLVGAVALAIAAFGAAHSIGIYRADVLTHGTPWMLLAIAGVMLLPGRLLRPYAVGALGLALVAYAGTLAGTHPLDYLDEWLSPPPRATRLFDWLAANRPAAVVGSGLRVGAIVLASPHTRAIDGLADDLCAEARSFNALLVSADDETVRPDERAGRRALARACGTVLYADDAALVVAPAAAK